MRTDVVAHLVKGCSIADTAWLTKVSPNTVSKLLDDVGSMCDFYLFNNMIKLSCKRLQVDEIWSFVKMKEKNVPWEFKGQPGYGDTYTWVALDPVSKLVPCFLIGRRDTEHAIKFIDDLAWRLRYRVQLTSDGHSPYLEAVEGAFSGQIDYAMLIKHYGGTKIGRDGVAKKCRRSECSSITKQTICGNPDHKHVSTSGVERQNRAMRMGIRRMTREVDAFSKKFWNHHAATALYFMFYNYARIHTTLGTTPAMAAGIEKRLWSIEDLVRLAD
jgi:IS1 family transposase